MLLTALLRKTAAEFILAGRVLLLDLRVRVGCIRSLGVLVLADATIRASQLAFRLRGDLASGSCSTSLLPSRRTAGRVRRSLVHLSEAPAHSSS